MAEESRNSWIFPSAGFAILASLLTGVFVSTDIQSAKKGSASASAGKTQTVEERNASKSDSPGDYSVSSRAWEDPLEATEALTYIRTGACSANAAAASRTLRTLDTGPRPVGWQALINAQ